MSGIPKENEARRLLSKALDLCSPSTVTDLAQTLQKEGLIQYSRGRVTILDRAGLERRCCECYRTVAEARASNPPLKPVSMPPSQS